jgi:hypothetical protein
MNAPIPINLAVEDELSESVLRKLLTQSEPVFAIGYAYRRGGFGYLRRTIAGFNQAARATPFVVMTDLDRGRCAPALIKEWLPQPQHPNLIFRVAVRAVEAWLLGHQCAFANFLGISEMLIPRDVDDLKDPKAALIRLAKRSRRRGLREAIVPREGSTARIGPDYNGCLSEFVTHHWEPTEAAASSPSLKRTLRRLRAFRPTWTR